MTTRVACLRLSPTVGDLEGNLALVRRALASVQADIVVLPELVTSGYVFASRDEAAAVAIEPDALAEWGSFGALVVGGFCERGEDGRLYNSAAIVDASGVVAVYRKTHLWDRERLIFTPGSVVPPVLDTAFRPARRARLLRPRVPGDAAVLGPARRRPAVRAGQLARRRAPAGGRASARAADRDVRRAREPRLHRGLRSRRCRNAGVEWVGGSAVIDENGWIVGASSADIDLARARDKVFAGLSDAFADRRPELYGDITAAP